MQGSLTKEFPLEQVNETIALARPGMSYDELRRLAGQRTNLAIPALLRNRFLLIKDERVVADRFLTFVEAEGLGTPRIRKIMYMTWALRDSRIRRFILERVCDNEGHWRPNQLTRKANADFFEKFLSANASTKARSNVEYFFAETGIYDARRRTINLDLADGWLPDAIQVAAQHETDAAQRRAMIGGPVDFLIARGWNGLANATVEELQGVENRVEFEDEVVEDDEIAVSYPTRLQGKAWDRQVPGTSARQQTSAQIDLVKRERATRAHHMLERIMAEAARANGYEPTYNEHIDMYFHTQAGSVLAEMKSCRETNLHAQVRRGVSQLLEYEYVYGAALQGNVTKTLVLQRRPTRTQAWLTGYLERLGILLAWKSSQGDVLQTTMPIPPTLVGIVAACD